MHLKVARLLILILFMLMALAAACTQSPDVIEQSYVELVEGADTAEISLALTIEEGIIRALEADSDLLFQAEIAYIGNLEYEVSGDSARRVRLTESIHNEAYGGDPLQWDIQLNPTIPISINLNIESGSMDADLSPLQITGLDLMVDSGSADITLPVSEESINASMDVSSGQVNMDIPDGVNLDFSAIEISTGEVTLDIGQGVAFEVNVNVRSGRLTFNIPDETAVQVNVNDKGSGDVNVPAGFEQTEPGEDPGEGTWESANFDDAETRIIINVEVSSGIISVR